MIDYQALTADLTSATELALSELEAQRPTETVFVFGYATDDDVVVLTPVANTLEEHQRMIKNRLYDEGGQVDSLLIQEWPLYGFGQQHFDKIVDLLNRYVHEPLPKSSESFEDRQINLLKAFGRALKAARGRRSGLFLSIFNPDPTLDSLALYYCVARLINPPGTMFDMYRDYVAQTVEANDSSLRDKLLEIKAKGMLISAL
jgi:hypothetical protein